jgi:hypothetical protein
MDPNKLFIIAAITLVVSLLIMYYIIQTAVKSALIEANDRNDEKLLLVQNRLLIKLLVKKGYTKQELIDLHNHDGNTFWDSIGDDKASAM